MLGTKKTITVITDKGEDDVGDQPGVQLRECPQGLE